MAHEASVPAVMPHEPLSPFEVEMLAALSASLECAVIVCVPSSGSTTALATATLPANGASLSIKSCAEPVAVLPDGSVNAPVRLARPEASPAAIASLTLQVVVAPLVEAVGVPSV